MFLLKRYEGGPILKPDDSLLWEREGVFNPRVIDIGDKIIMLYRAIGETESYISRLGLAVSTDGINFKRVSDTPVFEPKESFLGAIACVDLWGAY